MNDPPRQRRSLTHVGGPIRTQGDADDAAKLAQALDVAHATEDEEVGRDHVHGFHTYPARLHPDTAARLVAAFVPVGGTVLDPFCGSGTVLVEALLLGRRPTGVDLNPLAARLAQAKTRPRSPEELERLVAAARDCAASADERRKAKAGATRRFPSEDVQLFEPHVLLELDSLRAKVEATDEPARADLWLVLSSILIKLSRKRGDTSTKVLSRRTAAGFPSKLFVQRAEEWARRLAEMTSRLPTPWPEPPVVIPGDATGPRTKVPASVDAIVTSPPYAGTYDYVGHHELRLRWLGLDSRPLRRGEIGARATYQNLAPAAARATWERELRAFLAMAARVVPAGGPVVLVLGDSAVGKVALRADEIVAEVGRAIGFRPAACASQDRPHFHGPTAAAFRSRARAEHAILLRRA